MPRKNYNQKKGDKKKTKTPNKKKTHNMEITLKINDDDKIEMSKQLLDKRKSLNISSKPRHPAKNELKLCPNGKPMPPLAELEKMFEDSDDENESTHTAEPECTTPNKQNNSTEYQKNILSPKTVQQIALRIMDRITNVTDLNELHNELPAPPVVPQRKRKKPKEHYIVGCKDRPQVLKKPKAKFGQGDSEYGVDLNATNEDDEPPKKRAKNSRIPNAPKSIFNLKSDEIAEILRQNEQNHGWDSDSSTKTVNYDYNTCSPSNIRPQSFSPIPSTSRDNETIIKNDKLYNESFSINKNYASNANNSMRAMSIEIDDLSDDNVIDKIKPASKNPVLEYEIQEEVSINDESTNNVEIIEVPYETVVVDDSIVTNISNSPRLIPKYDNDNCVEIIETVNKTQELNKSPIDVDYYSSLNIYESYSEDVEVIDVDEVIAENRSIIEKYGSIGKDDSIITVDASILGSSSIEKIASSSPIVSSGTTNSVITELIKDTTSQHNDVTEASKNPVQYNDLASPNYNPVEVVTSFSNYNQNNNSTLELNQNSSFEGNANNMSNASYVGEIDGVRYLITPDDNIIIINSSQKIASSPRSRFKNRQVPNRHKTKQNVTNNSRPVLCHSDSNINLLDQSSPDPHVNQNIESPNRRSFGDCPICMESLAKIDIASTLCGHIFCMKCIKTSIKSSKKCPTCRKTLKGVGYHQIFL